MIFTPKKMHFQSYKNAPSIQIIEQLSITNAIKCPSLTPTRQKVLPLPTVRALSASNSPSALSVRVG